MKNLLHETIEALTENGKTTEDVCWVGAVVGKYSESKFVEIPTDEFWKVADRAYDNGFGGAEVNESLVIVGDDWWLERAEYDGSEWWEFKTLPKKLAERASGNVLTAIFNEAYL